MTNSETWRTFAELPQHTLELKTVFNWMQNWWVFISCYRSRSLPKVLNKASASAQSPDRVPLERGRSPGRATGPAPGQQWWETKARPQLPGAALREQRVQARRLTWWLGWSDLINAGIDAKKREKFHFPLRPHRNCSLSPGHLTVFFKYSWKILNAI